MSVKLIIEMTEEDAAKLEQAFKDGKLKELGIKSIEDVLPASPEKKQWADPSLGKRGNLKDDSGPKLP